MHIRTQDTQDGWVAAPSLSSLFYLGPAQEVPQAGRLSSAEGGRERDTSDSSVQMGLLGLYSLTRKSWAQRSEEMQGVAVCFSVRVLSRMMDCAFPSCGQGQLEFSKHSLHLPTALQVHTGLNE